MIRLLLVGIIMIVYKLNPRRKDKTGESITTGIGNESDTSNRAVDQNSENVNNKFLSSKIEPHMSLFGTPGLVCERQPV